MAAAPGAGEARVTGDKNVPGRAASNPSASTSRRLIQFMVCTGDGLSRCRQRRTAAVALEPAHHVQLRPHPVRRLRSGAVVFLIEAQQSGGDTAVLECLVELLALGDGRAPVQFT